MRRLAMVVPFLMAAVVMAAEPEQDCRFRPGEGKDPFQHWFARRKEAAPCVASGAATLVVQLPPEHTGVLYVPKQVVAFPVTERMPVPAGEELWLFVLAKGVPVNVIVINPIEAEHERTVDAREVKPAALLLVGWVQLPEADRTAVKNARGVSLPKILLTSGGKEIETGTLPPPELLDGAMVLFPGVTPGPAELRVSGRGWLRFDSKVTVTPQPVTLLRPPIVARATATLVVTWSTQADLATLDRSLGSCEVPPPPPRFELVVSSCTPPRAGEPVDATKCQLIRSTPLVPGATYGSVTVEELLPGFYLGELRFGKLPPMKGTMVLPPFGLQPLRLNAQYAEGYGSLTRGGKPLGEDAKIEFPNDGIGYSPRDGSDYHAVLFDRRPVLVGDDAKVDIVTCAEQKRTFILTDRPMVRSARLDIDIPDNVLTVTVVDTFTRRPISSATLRFTVMSSAVPRVPRVTRTYQASEGEGDGESREHTGGRFVIREVPVREIRLEVSSPGYEKQRIDPFTMPKSGTKEVEVQLVPVNESEGRILSRQPFDKGMIIWAGANGVETERADLAPDGKFAFAHPHFREETMTVVSLSHPLWITHAPMAERRKPLEVRFPDQVPVRDADISIPSVPSRLVTLIGVTIGNLRVPAAAFSQHLALRGEQPMVRGPGPLHVGALLETGPIEILRGPSVDPNFLARFSPELRPMATQRLPAAGTSVVFGLLSPR
jgi:hypothetical protein